MALDVESTTPSGALTASAGGTIEHTITAANKILVKITAGDGTAANRLASSVTWNGVGLTSVVSKHETSGNGWETASIWELHSPATGTHDLVVTMAGTCDQLAFGVTGYTGSAQA